MVDFEIQEGQAVASLAAGEYNFVAVGLANGKNENVKLELPSSLEDLDLAIPASAGAMVVQKVVPVSSDAPTQLKLDLQHLFTELTVKLDASEFGDVKAIESFDFSEVFENTNVTYDDDFKVNTKEGDTKKVITFNAAVAAAAKTWSSKPFFVYAGEGSQKVGFTLNGVTIDGIAGTHTLPFLNKFNIEPGARYTLTMKLVKKVEEPTFDAIAIGNFAWTTGSLTYDKTTGKYSIDDQGDYFFAGYQWPKEFNESNDDNYNKSASIDLNGELIDPCSLLNPAGTWRLPTVKEYENMIDATRQGTRPEGSPEPDAPNRYVSTIDQGIYFNAYNKDGKLDLENAIFFKFAGAYNNGSTKQEAGNQGYYWAYDESSKSYKYLQVNANIWMGVWDIHNYTNRNTSAFTIKCVTNNVSEVAKFRR